MRKVLSYFKCSNTFNSEWIGLIVSYILMRPEMKGSGQLLPSLGKVLLGEGDPVRDRGGVASPGLVDRVGLDPTLLSTETRHLYSLGHLIDLQVEVR